LFRVKQRRHVHILLINGTGEIVVSDYLKCFGNVDRQRGGAPAVVKRLAQSAAIAPAGTAVAAVATTATTPSSGASRLRFVDPDCPPLEVPAVELLDGSFRVRIACHLNEPETS
jgi:hypothetical protein